MLFCFLVLLALRLPRLGKRELILVSSSLYLGRAAACDCGVLLAFLVKTGHVANNWLNCWLLGDITRVNLNIFLLRIFPI